MSPLKLLSIARPASRSIRFGLCAIIALLAFWSQPNAGHAATATFVTTDTSTQGNWKGIYGSDGYNIVGDTSSNNPSDPSYAAANAAGAATTIISPSTSDTRGLQAALPASTTRVAANLNSATSFTLDVNITDGAPHQFALYMVDWNNAGLAQSVTIADAGTSSVLDTRAVTSFSGGQYLVWKVTGHVVVTIAATGGSPSAVLSGWFFDNPGPILSSIRVTPTSSSVAAGTNQQLTATGLDQFGNPLVTQPTFTWTSSGGGSVTSAGVFMAGTTTGGPFTVTATSGSVSGSATVRIAATHTVTFGTPVANSIGNVALVTGGDLDGDGHRDLIVQTTTNALIFLYGAGDGTFTRVNYPYPINTNYVTVGDIRGGGLRDIVATTGDSVAVIKNLGSRTYAAPVLYAAVQNGNDITLGDFDENGSLDIATVGSAHDQLAVLLNNGDGTFGAPTLQEIPGNVGGYAVSVALLDLNSDGHIDIACGQEDGQAAAYASVFTGDGHGNFTKGTAFACGGGALYSVDLNNDGLLDLANSDHWSNVPRWALSNGKGGFSLVAFQAGAGYAGRMQTYDFDGDGYIDLFESFDTRTLLYVNNGDGTFPLGTAYFLNAVIPVCGDFNEDGQPDAVMWNANTLFFYPNTTNPAPTITNIVPDGAAVGGSATLTVQGHGFLRRSVIYWNGSPLTTTFNFPAGTLTASLTATQLASAGTATVTVRTSTPGGGTSNAVPFYIGQTPTSISITPSTVSVNAGATAQLTATVLDQTGTPMPTQPVIGWKTFGKANTIMPTGLFSAGNTTGTFSATASYGGLTATVPITITDFTLSASPQAFTVAQGMSGSSTITVNALNGFNGNVRLTASNVPAGVVATFVPGSAGSTSTVTFTASPTATLGQATVTITGNVDGNPETTSIVLTIVKPLPTISSFSPASGVAGTKVTITGTYLTGTTSVKFNGTPSTSVVVVSDTSVTATVPSSATSGQISLTTPNGTATSAASFTVIPPAPTITSLSPSSGPIGTVVTVTGTNLLGATSMHFNRAATSALSNITATSLTVTVPSGATTGYVSVTTPGGTGLSSGMFTVTAPAVTITSFTPTSGPPGTSVTINGSNLTGATSVLFNGTASTSITNVTATSLTATVPAGATSGTIQVTTPQGTATSASSFTVTSLAPGITSFTPTSGPVGTSVTITGINFTGATAVAFNGTAATTFNVASATSITATVPSGAATGTISVTTPNGTATSSSSFTVTSLTPTVTSFSPTSGPVGTTVTVNGTNLTGATAVTINGTAATSVNVVSPTSLTAVVGAGTTSGQVAVTTPYGTATSAGSFTVTAPVPTITSFTPRSGPIGTIVTITGTNLAGVTSMHFNRAATTTFSNVTATSITVAVPAGATTGYVSVTTPQGTAMSPYTYTVTPPTPTITSFSPGSGPVGTSVTITGTNLTGTTSVLFNGTASTSITNVTATSVTATVPAGASSGTISLTTPQGTTTSATAFTVTAPPALSTFTFNPSSISAGSTSQATVTLTAPAPDGGLVVNISQGLFSYPLTVPAGATTASLPVTANAGTPSGSYPFTATYGAVSITTSLTIN